MVSQIAEHDGYFACNILSFLNANNKKLNNYYYGGLWEESMMMQLSHCKQIIDSKMKEWDTNVYSFWR
jgi:hypothetical protein